MKKYVNGELVDMTPAEIAEIEAIRANPPRKTLPDLTMAQFRLGMIDAGIDEAVDAAVKAMQGVDGKKARVQYEYRTTVRRESELITQLAPALNLTDEQIDAMWEHALTL